MFAPATIWLTPPLPPLLYGAPLDQYTPEVVMILPAVNTLGFNAPL